MAHLLLSLWSGLAAAELRRLMFITHSAWSEENMKAKISQRSSAGRDARVLSARVISPPYRLCQSLEVSTLTKEHSLEKTDEPL